MFHFSELITFPCKCISIQHNDLWRNNLLQKNKTDIILLDYQGWSVGPVAMDILRVLVLGGGVEEFQADGKCDGFNLAKVN